MSPMATMAGASKLAAAASAATFASV